MGLIGLFYPWGFILQAVAILHFVRRRPETYWLWIILIGGGLGALVYIVAEVVPDAGLLRGAFDAMGRRRRIRDLEAAILDNPSAGNLEELADQYLDEGRFARARELYDKVIASGRAGTLHPYYRRGLASVELGDFAGRPGRSGTGGGERSRSTTSTAPSACWRTPTAGRAIPRKPPRCSRTPRRFPRCPRRTTTTRRSWPRRQQTAEAREWAERILAKKPTMPGYLRRRERPWFRKAKALLKQLPARWICTARTTTVRTSPAGRSHGAIR